MTTTARPTKKEKLLKAIEASEEIQLFGFFDAEDFYNSAERYIKAVKLETIICSIERVSRYGDSRYIKFIACTKNKYRNGFQYLNFQAMFKALGYKPDSQGYSKIIGGGMDMVFHTNYVIIHRLKTLGFISKAQCSELAQNTPAII